MLCAWQSSSQRYDGDSSGSARHSQCHNVDVEPPLGASAVTAPAVCAVGPEPFGRLPSGAARLLLPTADKPGDVRPGFQGDW